jgi:hypothetical protein
VDLSTSANPAFTFFAPTTPDVAYHYGRALLPVGMTSRALNDSSPSIPQERAAAALLSGLRNDRLVVIRPALNGSRLPPTFEYPPSRDYLFVRANVNVVEPDQIGYSHQRFRPFIQSVLWNTIPAGAIGVVGSAAMVFVLIFRCCGYCKPPGVDRYGQSGRWTVVIVLSFVVTLVLYAP